MYFRKDWIDLGRAALQWRPGKPLDDEQRTLIGLTLATIPGGLAAMADCPNVVAKLSGFGMYSRRWTVAMIRPWVDALIAEFGPERCMYGSNYPVDRLGAPYARIMAAMDELLAGRDAGSRAAIMGGTARRVYRI